MSAERGGRKGDSGRSVGLCSRRCQGLFFLLALALDIACTFALLATTLQGDIKELSWGSLLDWTNKSSDLVLLLLVRLVVIYVVWSPLPRLLRINGDDGDDPFAVYEAEEGNDSNHGGVETDERRAGHDGRGDYVAVAQEGAEAAAAAAAARAADPFAAVRARSVTRHRNYVVKTVLLLLVFVVFTLCSVAVALKCLFFHFFMSPLQEVLMAITVLWVNVEVFSLDSYLDLLVGTPDAFKPGLHPHALRFNHRVTATKCDVCNQRIIKEDFECVSCDFDCCLPCYNRRSLSSAENVLNRGDRGVSAEQVELSPLSYVWRSFLFLTPYWRIVALSLGCLVVNQVIRVTLPNFQGKVLDAIIAGDQESFKGYIVYYCVLSAATLILGSVRSFGSMLVMRNLTMGVRERLFSKLIYRDISFFDGTTVGSLTARMTNDVQAMVQPVNTLMSSVLSNVITLVGGLFMCLTVSWRLAMISLTVVGPIVYITGTYARWSARINRGVWDALAQANSTATEAFVNIRTVRSFSTEEHEKEKFSESMEEALSKTLRDAVAFSGAYLATNLMDLGSTAVLLGFGGYMVMSRPEELSLGQLVTFQLYANMMNGAYQGLNGVLNQFTKSAGAAERVLTMLDGEPDIDPRKGTALRDLEGTIEVQHVSFFYQMRPDRVVLRDVSVVFPRNSVTAIVGRSGGGKSTLMHLLLRFYDPQEGLLLVDGHDLRTLSLPWLHHQFAVVAQDTQLFNTSIEANIAYGLETYDPASIRKAAMDANAHDFIMGFPEGYRTSVGERGVRLSGGQRQRIAIARALLRRPRVLLLDEATSALDAESEALVQQALDKLIEDLSQSCTIVVIAHRLSTIVNADNIVVLDGGRVAEQGTHQELLNSEGAYYRLVSRQLRDGRSTLDFDDGVSATASSRPENPRGRGRGTGGGNGGRGQSLSGRSDGDESRESTQMF